MSDTKRDDAAHELVKAVGWVSYKPGPCFYGAGSFLVRSWFVDSTQHFDRLWLPLPDAPLHEHLAFVGRVADVIGVDRQGFAINNLIPDGWFVKFRLAAHGQSASDPSWAAMLAAVEAKR